MGQMVGVTHDLVVLDVVSHSFAQKVGRQTTFRCEYPDADVGVCRIAELGIVGETVIDRALVEWRSDRASLPFLAGVDDRVNLRAVLGWPYRPGNIAEI